MHLSDSLWILAVLALNVALILAGTALIGRQLLEVLGVDLDGDQLLMGCNTGEIVRAPVPAVALPT